MRNIWLAFFVAALFLAGCREESPAQQEDVKKETAEVSLEQRCKELSEQGEYQYQYQAITAETIGTEFFPPRSMDCFEAGGCLQGQATFIAVMKVLNANMMDKGEELAVYTKLEPQKDLFSKEQYMQSGKHYVFCARKVERFEFIDVDKQTDKPKYKIDFVETIQPLN